MNVICGPYQCGAPYRPWRVSIVNYRAHWRPCQRKRLVTTQPSQTSLSTKPSVTSLRHVPTANDLPLPLPAILQEHDQWSDRLGLTNFTITPVPYELETITTDTVTKFRNNWEGSGTRDRINCWTCAVASLESHGRPSAHGRGLSASR